MYKTLLAASLLAALPFTASASDSLSYTYVEAGYIYTDSDNASADGFAIKGMVAVHPSVHLFADYSRQRVDEVEVDVDQWRAGIGYNHELSSTTDLLLRASWLGFRPEYGTDVNGYALELGGRLWASRRWQVEAVAGWEDYSEAAGVDPKGEFYGRLGALAQFNEYWGLSAQVRVGKHSSSEWFLGPRASW